MGVVIKQTGSKIINVQTGTVQGDQKKARKKMKAGDTRFANVPGTGILIYAEHNGAFTDFLNRHVRRKSAGQKTILVEGKDKIPSDELARVVVETSLLNALWAGAVVHSRIVVKDIRACTWDPYEHRILRCANPGKIQFRDILDLSRGGVERAVGEYISAPEYDEILQVTNESDAGGTYIAYIKLILKYFPVL